MAVKDVCNLGTRQFNTELFQYPTDVLNTTLIVLNFYFINQLLAWLSLTGTCWLGNWQRTDVMLLAY